jgi:hypothetical protein
VMPQKRAWRDQGKQRAFARSRPRASQRNGRALALSMLSRRVWRTWGSVGEASRRCRRVPSWVRSLSECFMFRSTKKPFTRLSTHKPLSAAYHSRESSQDAESDERSRLSKREGAVQLAAWQIRKGRAAHPICFVEVIVNTTACYSQCVDPQCQKKRLMLFHVVLRTEHMDSEQPRAFPSN